jgi:hypothetical protein
MKVVPLMKRPQQKRSRISREHSRRTRHPRMVMGVVISAAIDAEAATRSDAAMRCTTVQTVEIGSGGVLWSNQK